ncbi:MAG: lipopolysaccharide export system protein LptA [Granulosicoccus sp.]|jgi:lipopolysaccharide export system protein LptA
MNPAKQITYTIFLIGSLLLATAQKAIALPDDREQPINVSADKARKNSNQGLTIYQGNVIITQGSIRVTGDEVAIYDDNGAVSKMIAKGAAEFRQRPTLESSETIANGSTIEYDIKKETLLLLDNAKLEQGGDITTSNMITYDMKSTIVNAGDENGRVIMTLQPVTQ